MRATTRLAGCSISTVTKLLVDLGTSCAIYQNKTLRKLRCKRLQLDEIWSFCYSKQKNTPPNIRGLGRGDVWTWVAIDADTKLVRFRSRYRKNRATLLIRIKCPGLAVTSCYL